MTWQRKEQTLQEPQYSREVVKAVDQFIKERCLQGSDLLKAISTAMDNIGMDSETQMPPHDVMTFLRDWVVTNPWLVMQWGTSNLTKEVETLLEAQLQVQIMRETEPVLRGVMDYEAMEAFVPGVMPHDLSMVDSGMEGERMKREVHRMLRKRRLL